jgi:hypothetical protein
MPMTVTDHRVVPKTLLFWELHLVEKFVVVDGDETSVTPIALYVDESEAYGEAQRRGRNVAEE